MFTMAKKDDMGHYLEKLIYKKYPSVRQFGAACLREEHAEVNDETLRKRSNRLSQIIHGKKSIQVADLPIFSKLLEVSCEEILGASKYGAPADGHLDNYKVATSTDPAIWEKYTALEERPILNADEYGKTVIDYAMEFQNYSFLQYMVKAGYIYFAGEAEARVLDGFGAGTKIPKPESCFRNYDRITTELAESGQLRKELLFMAIQHKDLDMLEHMHAREIPPMYLLTPWGNPLGSFSKYYDQELIDTLVKADADVIAWFSEETTIENLRGDNQKLIYPFLGELAEALIKAGKKTAIPALKAAIAHNRAAYQVMFDGVKETRDKLRSEYDSCRNDDARQMIQEQLDYLPEDFMTDKDGKTIAYMDRYYGKNIVVDVTHVTAETSDPEISQLLRELEKSCQQFTVLQHTGC